MLTVLIPHAGSATILQPLLESLAREATGWPILVGDDSDALPKIKGVKILPGPHRGFAANANKLVAAATTEWVVLLNNDTELVPGWGKALTDYLKTAPAKVALVATTVLKPTGRHDSAGDTFSLVLGRPLKRGYGKRSLWAAAHFPLLSVSGAVLVVRRAVWQELGGLDESFGQYYEDVDFGWRLQAAGWRLAFAPMVRTIHREGSSMPSLTKAYFTARNSIWLLKRHLPDDKWLQWRLTVGWKLLAGSGERREAIQKGLQDGLATDPPPIKKSYVAGAFIKSQCLGWRELLWLLGSYAWRS